MTTVAIGLSLGGRWDDRRAEGHRASFELTAMLNGVIKPAKQPINKGSEEDEKNS